MFRIDVIGFNGVVTILLYVQRWESKFTLELDTGKNTIVMACNPVCFLFYKRNYNTDWCIFCGKKSDKLDLEAS